MDVGRGNKRCTWVLLVSPFFAAPPLLVSYSLLRGVQKLRPPPPPALLCTVSRDEARQPGTLCLTFLLLSSAPLLLNIWQLRSGRAIQRGWQTPR
jgi:hypothetical protein